MSREAIATPTSPTAWFAYMSRYGQAILERREVRGFTGPSLAKASKPLEFEDPGAFEGFSQQTVSRWESDTTGELIGASSPRKLRALARLLEWSATEFHERVGVNPGPVPGMPDAATTYATPIDTGPQKALPVYSAVGAGPGEDDGEIVDYMYIGADEDGDVVYEVNGHSMEPEIPHGSRVIVERDHYDLGDLVVAYSPAANGMVVKRLVADKDNHRAILASKNPDYGALIADGAKIVGRVIAYQKRVYRKR